MTLDELCIYSAQIGLKGVDLLKPEEFEVPKSMGLICTMATSTPVPIPDALQRGGKPRQDRGRTAPQCSAGRKGRGAQRHCVFRKPHGMSDEEGAKNVILGLNRVKKLRKTITSSFAWNC